MIKIIKYFLSALVILPAAASALTFELPSLENSVVGKEHIAVVRSQDDVTALGERNGIGSFELAEANPDKDIKHIYVGEEVSIPSRYILPPEPRQGIVINLSELRLYFYPPGKNVVMTFPVGIGKPGAVTPLLHTKIIEKKTNPRWYPARSTREEALAQGIVLPRFVEAGPDNPLGNFAMRLGVPEYLIHGTHDPTGVGIRSSAGCIRMYPEDVKELYGMVKIGTPVLIIDQPYKVGFNGKKLELESHVLLDGTQGKHLTTESIAQLNEVLMPVVNKYHVTVDWDRALAVAREQLGVPQVIGFR